MRSAITSKLTTKCQTTIPEKIRGILGLHPGDSVMFEVAEETKRYLFERPPRLILNSSRP
jgi:AbrB family looped-hinge helix DNA binding protein